MDKLEAIIGDYEAFLAQLLREVEEGFDLSDFVQMDHMCYRVPTIERYETKKKELATVGQLLGETPVNGRSISTFRLHEPVRYDNWRIDAVELPAPKAGSPVQEGLEHVEFVLYNDLKDFLKKYTDKDFNLNAATRGINPEVAFKLPSYTVKFHLLSLPAVVYLERKLGITGVKD